MHFYFWVNYINPHQTPFILALANMAGHSVTLLPETYMLAKRKLTKWEAPELPNVDVILKPGDAEIRNIIHQSDKDSVHIFHGMHSPDQITKALTIAKQSKRRIAVWSEPYNSMGFKGKIRYLRTLYHKIKYDKGIDFFLATGNQGIKFLQKAGHSNSKIFDWGYFPEKLPSRVNPITKTFNIGFVGFLIHRKGVDHLLHAITKVNKANICVTIVGEGPQKTFLEKIVSKYSLNCIRFQSFITASEVSQFMSMQDILVLPSRFDGWGAVVNEALLQGTPVICSDNCGASVLLKSENCSSVYKTGAVDSLANLINNRINDGKLQEEERKKIKEWASCISGESAAKYFGQIIDHVYNKSQRPIPPWQSTFI